jgi:hypothetical protein
MVLFLANGAGAVTWDLGTGYQIPTPTASYAIYNNGGLINSGIQQIDKEISAVTTGSVTPPPLPISNTNSWTGGSNFITWEASAGGGTAAAGAYANASLSVNYDLNGIAGLQSGYQYATSSLQRSFVPEALGNFTVSGSLAGTVNWPSFGNPDNDSVYNTYLVSGVIEVTKHQVVGGSMVGAAQILNLSDSNKIGSLTINFDSIEYYYTLLVQLTLKTWMQNSAYPINLDDLNPTGGSAGSHSIGNSPYQLNAEVVSAVPIPGSLVLLVSGIAGLVAIKRRKAA